MFSMQRVSGELRQIKIKQREEKNKPTRRKSE